MKNNKKPNLSLRSEKKILDSKCVTCDLCVLNVTICVQQYRVLDRKELQSVAMSKCCALDQFFLGCHQELSSDLSHNISKHHYS